MKRISITTVLLFITIVSFGQSVKTVKTYYDYFKTKIKAIEQVTQDFEMHGVQKYYLEDGCLWRLYNYKFGKQDGVQKQLYCNGKINIISNYKEGLKQGEYKSYKYDREKYFLEEKYNYDKDVATEYTFYYSNGNKKIHQVLDGICNEYYESGKKMTEYTNINGYEDGKMTVWYEDGKTAYIGYYKEGKNDGEWKYFDVNREIYRTENWKYTPNVPSNIKTGKWKFYYKVVNDKWVITSQVDSAEYFRIIDYSFEVPKEMFNYAKSSNVFKAYDYYITGEKQWEGYVDEENMSTSYFNTKVFIEVGDCKFYRKDGTVQSSGILMHNKKKNEYEYSSIKVGKWTFYDNANEVEYAEIWQLEKGYRGNTSKLVSKKDKVQLKKDEEDFNQFILQGDKYANEAKYEEAITFYNKALAIFPNNTKIRQKVQIINTKIEEQQEIERKNKYDSCMLKGNRLVENEKFEEAISSYNEALLLYPEDVVAIQKKKETEIMKVEKKKKIEEAFKLYNENAVRYNATEKEVKNLYTVKDIIKSEALGQDVYKIKKKKLYNAYVIYRDNLISKAEKSDDAFYKNEVLDELFKLSEKMIKLFDEKTKDIEKLLKSETNPDKIKQILEL